MFKKIEVDILLFMLIESLFLLFFFDENLSTIIIGIILGIILVSIFKHIKKNSIIKFILFIISLPLSIITIYNTTQFINFNILKGFSIYPIILSFLGISIYLVCKDYHTFIKSVSISFYFFIFLKLISLILIIPKTNINNLLPIDNNINYHFILIGLSILYLYLSTNYLTNYQINKKRLFIILINPLFIKTITILTIGNTLLKLYKYPYVNYLKTIRYFDFIERIDGILSFEYLFSFFFFFTFILFNIKLLYKKSI